jgi:hypothetical protein
VADSAASNDTAIRATLTALRPDLQLELSERRGRCLASPRNPTAHIPPQAPPLSLSRIGKNPATRLKTLIRAGTEHHGRIGDDDTTHIDGGLKERRMGGRAADAEPNEHGVPIAAPQLPPEAVHRPGEVLGVEVEVHALEARVAALGQVVVDLALDLLGRAERRDEARRVLQEAAQAGGEDCFASGWERWRLDAGWWFW